MADSYIDQDETQIYGSYTAGKLKIVIGGIDPIYAPLAQRLSDQIAALTHQVAVALGESRAAQGEERRGVAGKTPALRRGTTLLGRFSKHLAAHDEGVVDRHQFFPQNGTADGEGSSGPKVLAALRRIATELRQKGTRVADGAAWLKKVELAADSLAPGLTLVDAGRTRRKHVTPELAKARSSWKHVYGATKTIVEGILKLHDKLDLMPQIFHDLSVRSPRKAPVPAPAKAA